MQRKAWMLLMLPLLAASIACGTVVDGVLSGLDDEDIIVVDPPPVDPAEEQNVQSIEEQSQESAQQTDTGTAQKLAPEVLTRALSGANFEAFDSYVAAMVVQMNGVNANDGTPVTLELTMDMQGQREPESFGINLDMTATGIQGAEALAGGAGSMNMIVTPELTYLQTAEGGQNSCFAMPSDTADSADFNPEDMLFGTDEFFNGETPPELLLVNPSEQVNGVNAAHYRAENIQDTEFKNMTVDVWVALDVDYVVKFTAQGDGNFDMDDGVFFDGTIIIDYNLISVNQGINLLIPENCQEFNFDAQ